MSNEVVSSRFRLLDEVDYHNDCKRANLLLKRRSVGFIIIIRLAVQAVNESPKSFNKLYKVNVRLLCDLLFMSTALHLLHALASQKLPHRKGKRFPPSHSISYHINNPHRPKFLGASVAGPSGVTYAYKNRTQNQ